MFDTVLVANRGEIAVRIFRTLRRLGVRSVAVYSDADANARHVREADTAIRIGAAPAVDSYLRADRLVEAALATGAQAVHPGYGFLAENAAFARAVEAAGLVFVGPPPAAIEAMGDKITAKRTVAAAGVPVVPGLAEPGLDDAALRAAAIEVGLPVLIKPSAGGGGKGMRLVRDPAALTEQIQGARREARSAFGDDTLFVERFVDQPRHIEIQVLADAHGNVIHLGERECSLQRRHQKIIEEAPSPLLDEPARAAMGAAAVAAARSCGYTGAGTVEFIVSASAPDEFFFMEMNTRLQVEHPVTELVTGLDLVEAQLRVAAGEPLGLSQGEVALRGHAIEARVYAEDPARSFLPTGGLVLDYAEPVGPGIRVDSGLVAGTLVGSDYDPMLAKVVAHAAGRRDAVRLLRRALAQTQVLGVRTNVAFLRALLADPEVVAGRLDTGLVERELAHLTDDQVPPEVFAAAGLARLLALEPRPGTVVDPFDLPGGWRVGEHAWTRFHLRPQGGETVLVALRGRAGSAQVRVGAGEPVAASAVADGGELLLTYAGRLHRFACRQQGPVTHLGLDGQSWALAEAGELLSAAGEQTALSGPLRAPMPGTVSLVKVPAGEPVRAGQTLLVVEAMKMEHVIVAPSDGVVSELRVRAGQAVALDEPLVTVAAEASGPGDAAPPSSAADPVGG
jgi:acetyl-CoA/propionyl-CoA carboxylase biotin carboxyl carrier protein